MQGTDLISIDLNVNYNAFRNEVAGPAPVVFKTRCSPRLTVTLYSFERYWMPMQTVTLNQHRYSCMFIDVDRRSRASYLSLQWIRLIAVNRVRR